MAEEKQTPENIDDTLSHDDTSVLRYVLEHTRGAAPVSVYNQSEMFDFDEDEAVE
ncbi:MAG: hypothetical protein WBP12_00705 [Candidatus Saccharimonas sp.]